MEALRGENGEEVQFRLNEIVWAKIIGYPWWPCRITQLPTALTSDSRVDFFHENSHAFVASHKMAKYKEMRCDIDLHRHMAKGLRKAIVEVDSLLEQEDNPATASGPAQGPVEAPLSEQKQLFKSPPPPTLLQENIVLPEIVQKAQEQHEISVSNQDSSEILSDSLPQTNSILKYSHEQRDRFVSTLLKKYRLATIPKTAEPSCPGRGRPQGAPATAAVSRRRRTASGRRQGERRTKMISKLAYPKHSFFYLLTRKVHSVLMGKPELGGQQRREISSSLAREMLGGEGGSEELLGLFKWLAISPSATIASFYQNWGCLQGEKEKSSNMTTEE